MLSDIAAGVGDPLSIAHTYGFDTDAYMRLATQDWYHRAIAEKRAQLEAEGFTFKAKMGMLAEELLVDVYQAAKLTDSVANKLDVAKYLTKISGLEPQPGAVNQTSGGFSVTINFPTVPSSPNAQPQSITIEATPVMSDEIEGVPNVLVTHEAVTQINRDLVADAEIVEAA